MASIMWLNCPLFSYNFKWRILKIFRWLSEYGPSTPRRPVKEPTPASSKPNNNRTSSLTRSLWRSLISIRCCTNRPPNWTSSPPWDCPFASGSWKGTTSASSPMARRGLARPTQCRADKTSKTLTANIEDCNQGWSSTFTIWCRNTKRTTPQFAVHSWKYTTNRFTTCFLTIGIISIWGRILKREFSSKASPSLSSRTSSRPSILSNKAKRTGVSHPPRWISKAQGLTPCFSFTSNPKWLKTGSNP